MGNLHFDVDMQLFGFHNNHPNQKQPSVGSHSYLDPAIFLISHNDVAVLCYSNAHRAMKLANRIAK
jgi:hypothetical protein